MRVEDIKIIVKAINELSLNLRSTRLEIKQIDDEYDYYRDCVNTSTIKIEDEINKACNIVHSVVNTLSSYNGLLQNNSQLPLVCGIRNLNAQLAKFSFLSSRFTFLISHLAPQDISQLYKVYRNQCLLIQQICGTIPVLNVNAANNNAEHVSPQDLIYMDMNLFETFTAAINHYERLSNSLEKQVLVLIELINSNKYYGFHKIIKGTLPPKNINTSWVRYKYMQILDDLIDRPDGVLIIIDRVGDRHKIESRMHSGTFFISPSELKNFLAIHSILISQHTSSFQKDMIRCLIFKILCQNNKDPEGEITPNVEYTSHLLRVPYKNLAVLPIYLKTLPSTINHLMFGGVFMEINQIISSIPKNISTITFENMKTQPWRYSTVRGGLFPRYFYFDFLPEIAKKLQPHIKHLNIVYDDEIDKVVEINKHPKKDLIELGKNLPATVKSCTLDLSAPLLLDLLSFEDIIHIHNSFRNDVSLRIIYPRLFLNAVKTGILTRVSSQVAWNLVASHLHLVEHIDIEYIIDLIRSLPQSRELDLSRSKKFFEKDVNIEDNPFIRILPRLPAHFKDIVMSHNGFGETYSPEHFCSVLQSLPSHVTVLSLSDNALGNFPIEGMITALSELMKNLKFIDLSNNSLHKYVASGLTQLLSIVQGKSISINLRGNQLERLGEKGINQLLMDLGFEILEKLILDEDVMKLIMPFKLRLQRFHEIIKEKPLTESSSSDLTIIFNFMPMLIVNDVKKILEGAYEFEIDDFSNFMNTLFTVIDEQCALYSVYDMQIELNEILQVKKKLHYIVGHHLITMPDDITILPPGEVTIFQPADLNTQDDGVMTKMKYARVHLEAAGDYPNAKELYVYVEHFVTNLGKGLPNPVAKQPTLLKDLFPSNENNKRPHDDNTDADRNNNNNNNKNAGEREDGSAKRQKDGLGSP